MRYHYEKPPIYLSMYGQRPAPVTDREPPVQVVHQFVSCRPNDLFTLLTHLHYLLSRPGLAAPADIEVKSALSS